MNTGFSNLDKYIKFDEPELIVFTGVHLIDMLSGDIANNVCLKQEKDVLEIVDSVKKEYLIKRLFVNEASVNYRKWTLKDKYNDEELKRIGQTTLDLIETTRRLPIILDDLYGLRNIKKIVLDYANKNADRDIINTLIVLDIFPFNIDRYIRKSKLEILESVLFIKYIRKICKELRCTIILISQDTFLNKRIKKYIDKFLIAEYKSDSNIDIQITKQSKIIGITKLKYNNEFRKFEEIKG